MSIIRPCTAGPASCSRTVEVPVAGRGQGGRHDRFPAARPSRQGCGPALFREIDRGNGEPETVTIDKSGANLAALEASNAERETPIKVRQTKYLNNIIEQDHRAITRRTRPMLGFKNFRCARILPSGIEVMHMIR